MTVDANALFLNIDNVYTAANLGVMARDLFNEGRVTTGFMVTQRGAGANMSVDVSAGVAYVAGDYNTNLQPLYRVYNDATVNLVVNAADPVDDRWDIVVLEVLDSVFSGAQDLARLRVIAGTPSGTPAEPTLPNNCLKLARIEVGSGATSVITADITDKATYAQTGGGSAHFAPVVASLPANPFDGQIVRYQADSTNGCYWMLQYRSTSVSSYKWEYLGGTPLFSSVATQESTTSTTYTDLATVGPSCTAPLAGDYLVEIGGSLQNPAGYTARMSYAIGGTAASDANCLQSFTNTTAVMEQSAYGKRVHTGISASTLFRAKYRSDNSGTHYFQRRVMYLTPIRVG